MPQLHYLIGDATDPIKKPAMIVHCCNDCGGFGKGFVSALKAKYPETEKAYKQWYATGKLELGQVQFVQVSPDVYVANLIGQHGIRWEGKIPPIRYDAMERGFETTYKKALEENLTVHAPRLGCALAGGSWEAVEKLILKNMTVDTYIYTLENQKDRWPTDYENL
jgi:O-acetyl-ADP-ribose deacetylase (regulator of RNase III)